MIDRIVEHRAAVLEKYRRPKKVKKKKTASQKTQKGRGKRAPETFPKAQPRRDTVKRTPDTRPMRIDKPEQAIRGGVTPADITKGYTTSKGGRKK